MGCLCVVRISAWRPRSRSSFPPSRAHYSSTSIIMSTWYVPMATNQSTEKLETLAENDANYACFFLISLAVSLCCPQKREKRKEEDQMRKEWVDQEREKTLSRLRSFREVRLCHCLCSMKHQRQNVVISYSNPVPW